MPQYKVNYGFTKLPDAGLAAFGLNVETQLTGNTAFPSLPVAITVLTTKREAFSAAMTVAAQGGVLNTALKNAAKLEYIDALRDDAGYVQAMSNRDVAAMLSSGYQVSSTNRTRQQLPKPLIKRIYVPVSSVIAVDGESLVNARAYEVRVKNGTGDYVTFSTFTYARRIQIPDRVPGQTYSVQFRAIGGLTGYSDWSEPATIMAT